VSSLMEAQIDDPHFASSEWEDSASLRKSDVHALSGHDLLSSRDDLAASSLQEESQDQNLSVSLLEGPGEDPLLASSRGEESMSIRNHELSALMDEMSSQGDPHFASSFLEASQDEVPGYLEEILSQSLAEQSPRQEESSLLEESSEECPKIVIGQVDLQDTQAEPGSPQELQEEASQEMVSLMVQDALGDSMVLGDDMASRLVTPQPEELASEADGSPTSPGALNVSRDTAWISDGLVANVIDDAVDAQPASLMEESQSLDAGLTLVPEAMVDGSQSQSGLDIPASEDVMDPFLVDQLQQALAVEPVKENGEEVFPSHAYKSSTEDRAAALESPVPGNQREADSEAEAAVCGILRAGLSNRSSPLTDFEGSESSEASINVVDLVMGVPIQEVVQAYDESGPRVGLASSQYQEDWGKDSGIDEDVAGPSIEDLGKTNLSIAEIHQEVEDMVPADE